MGRDKLGTLNLLQYPTRGHDLLPPFVPLNAKVDPILSIKLTDFTDGSALGVYCNHVVCDAAGLFGLVGHLAELYTQPGTSSRLPPVTTPFHPNPEGPSETRNLRTIDGQSVDFLGPDSSSVYQDSAVTRHLHFDQAFLDRLKHAEPAGHRTSSYVASLSLLWQAYRRACVIRHTRNPKGGLRTPAVIVCSSIRGLHPGMPMAYFGNAVYENYVSEGEIDLSRASLSSISAQINAVIRRKHLKDPSYLESTARWINQQVDKSKIDFVLNRTHEFFVSTQWNWKGTESEKALDPYDAIASDGVRPDLVSTVMADLYKNALITLPPPRGSIGLLLCLGLDSELWKIIDEFHLLDPDRATLPNDFCK